LKNVGQVGAIVIGAALAALPGAVVVILVEMFMRPPGMTISVQQLSTLWLQVTLIGVAIGHFEFFTWPFKEEAHVAPAFLDRLPEHVSRKTDVISLSMQDHYVEATTDNGTFVVLMRLSDAMNEFAPDHGIQIHRSHWVARSHMKGKHKTGNRTFLDLSDGRSLPVSLTYLPEVERALSG
jgi:hypothetical protein